MSVSMKDKEILRTLASRVAEIAVLPQQEDRRRLWTGHNDLTNKTPIVLCFPEGSWLECIPPETLEIEDPLLRNWETKLRMAIYTCEVIGDDQVIDAVFNVPWDVSWTYYGIEQEITLPEGSRNVYYVHPYVSMSLTSNSNLGAYHVEPALKERSDLDRLVPRKVTINHDTSDYWLDTAHDIFDGILDVRRRLSTWLLIGAVAPSAVRLRGMENLMYDMFDDPAWVHRFLKFLSDDHNDCLDVLESGGYLTPNNGCEWIGTGGLGYTSHLPQPDFSPSNVRLCDVWGGAEAQDLVGISGDMFGEYFMPYLKPIMERYGLSHYGCCEPVHDWFQYLRTIKNLRRVSISPWADVSKCAEQIRGDYVFSYKPNPTSICTGTMDDRLVLAELVHTLSIVKEHGCVPEVIMKDLHTINHEPARIPRWIQLARQAVNSVYE